MQTCKTENLAFGSKTVQYATNRPDWTHDDVDMLLIQTSLPLHNLAGKIVVDMGAGNGLLTQHFIERGASVIAVEPDTNMLQELRKNITSPSLIISESYAENPAIPDEYKGKVDLIVSGNAHHWWGRHLPGNDGDPSTEKNIVRSWRDFTRPGAKLAICFNKMVEESPFTARLQEIGLKHFSADPAHPLRSMESPFAPAKREPFEKSEFADYFAGEARGFQRFYDMVIRDYRHFQSWLTSHSFVPNDVFEGPAHEDLQALYESLPDHKNGKSWPFRMTAYAAELNIS